MVKIVEINGIDESGAVGENILFVRIGIPLPYELHIILRNIEYFDRLMIDKEALKGYEKKSLMKYVVDYMDDPSFDVTIFRMFPETQLRLLRELFFQATSELFQAREPLVTLFGPEGKVVDSTLEDRNKISETISDLANKLKKFRRSTVYLESFIKSYGMMSITQKLPSFSRLFSQSGKVSRLLVVQIDGGYPFAFWWKSLTSDTKTKFKKGSFVISGVSNGDGYYPSMSTAGAIAKILLINFENLHLFPVHPLEYANDIDSAFYENHATAMTFPTFQNRILFVGAIREDVRRCIPYLVHLEDRSKTYEPFYVGTGMKWFFKIFGPGNPENTMIIYGKLTSTEDKENVKFCEESGYSIRHISEFKDEFQELVNNLQSEIKFAPIQKRKSLSSKLKKIEETCLSELK